MPGGSPRRCATRCRAPGLVLRDRFTPPLLALRAVRAPLRQPVPIRGPEPRPAAPLRDSGNRNRSSCGSPVASHPSRSTISPSCRSSHSLTHGPTSLRLHGPLPSLARAGGLAPLGLLVALSFYEDPLTHQTNPMMTRATAAATPSIATSNATAATGCAATTTASDPAVDRAAVDLIRDLLRRVRAGVEADDHASRPMRLLLAADLDVQRGRERRG